MEENAATNFAELDTLPCSLLTTANQRWLAIRLDFCGAILIFCVAVMSATNTTLSPAVIGLTLTCALTSRGVFGFRIFLTLSPGRSHVLGPNVRYDDETKRRIGEQHECKSCEKVCAKGILNCYFPGRGKSSLLCF